MKISIPYYSPTVILVSLARCATSASVERYPDLEQLRANLLDACEREKALQEGSGIGHKIREFTHYLRGNSKYWKRSISDAEQTAARLDRYYAWYAKPAGYLTIGITTTPPPRDSRDQEIEAIAPDWFREAILAELDQMKQEQNAPEEA